MLNFLCFFVLFKPRSHIVCDCDAIALRANNLTIAEKSQRSRKGFIEVAKRSDRSPDQIGRELSFEHAQKTDHD